MPINPTQLRENLYKILDQVIETQAPVDIIRGKHRLQIIPKETGNQRKLSNLKPHPGTINGDPEHLLHEDWSNHWGGDKEL